MLRTDHADRVLTPAQRQDWERDGFIILPGFATEPIMSQMLDRVIDICRRAAAGDRQRGQAFVVPEAKVNQAAVNPEDLVSKVFRLHRDTVFETFARDERLLAYVADVLATDDLDCFLSQFIFKNSGAMGQPWHQDSYYFPFTPARPHRTDP